MTLCGPNLAYQFKNSLEIPISDTKYLLNDYCALWQVNAVVTRGKMQSRGQMWLLDDVAEASEHMCCCFTCLQ